MANINSLYGNPIVPENDHTHNNKDILDGIKSITNLTVLQNVKNPSVLTVTTTTVPEVGQYYFVPEVPGGFDTIAWGDMDKFEYGTVANMSGRDVAVIVRYDKANSDNECGEFTAIKAFLGEYALPLLDDFITDAELYDFNTLETINKAATYSTKPTRIGTWIDGTPVWREAFTYTMSDELDITDLKDGYGYSSNISVTDQNKAFSLNAECWLRTGQEPCIIDDIQSTYFHNGHFEFDTAYIHFTGLAVGVSGYYGYVEYVTPESNIEI